MKKFILLPLLALLLLTTVHAAINDSLYYYFPFDSDMENKAYLSPTLGTIYGSPSLTNSIHGKSLNLSVNGSYIDLGLFPSALTSSAQHSMNVMLYADSAVSPKTILRDNVSSTFPSYYVRTQSVGFPATIGASNSNTAGTTTGGYLSGFRWTMLTIVYNGTRQLIYVDGVKIEDVAWTNAITNGIGVSIGKGASSSEKWQGLIDNVAMWNRSLTASEVLQLNTSNGSIAYANERVLRIYAVDSITATNLQNFSATFNQTTLSTTNGEIITSIILGTNYSLNLSSEQNGGYFQSSLINISNLLVYTANLSQSFIYFNVSYIVTNELQPDLVNVTFRNTTGTIYGTYRLNQTNNYLNFTRGTYNISFAAGTNASLWFTGTQTNVIINPLSNMTLNISVADAQINTSFIDNVSGSAVSTFNYNITSTTNNYFAQGISGAANAPILVKKGLSYIINASKANYITASGTSSPTQTYNTLNLSAIPQNSLYVRIFDQLTGLRINQSITVASTGNNLGGYYSNTTNTGSLIQYPVVPDTYLVYFTSANYSNTTAAATVVSGGTSNLSVYLLPLSASPQTATITTRDSTGANVQGATVTIYSIVNGTNTQLLQMQTDITGVVTFSVRVGSSYTIIVNKLGYQTISFSTTFNTLSYTLTLQGSQLQSYGTSDLSGVNYYSTPINNTLPLNNAYPFVWSATSIAGTNMSQTSMTIYNAAGVVLYTNSIIGGNGGTLSTTLNTSLYNGSYVYVYTTFTKQGFNQVSFVNTFWITDGGRAGSISGLASYIQANLNIQQQIILWVFACIIIPFAMLLVFMRVQLASIFVGAFCVWAGLAIFSFNPIVMMLFASVFFLIVINGGQI